MNIRLDIEYIGTNFCGWQRQRGSPTIQGELEKCLKNVYKKNVTLLGSGRTDSGVHAYNQVANFHIDENHKINMVGLRNDLNSLLNGAALMNCGLAPITVRIFNLMPVLLPIETYVSQY